MLPDQLRASSQQPLYHALVLLAENTPVATVAHLCGWSSASAFLDVFRHTFGHTPGTCPCRCVVTLEQS